MNAAEVYIRDARQVIVKELATKDSLTLSSTHLEAALERFGIVEPPEWMFKQIDWLAMMGAVTYRDEASVRVVTLTDEGARHVRGVKKIDGIGRPSLARLGVDLITQGLKSGG